MYFLQKRWNLCQKCQDTSGERRFLAEEMGLASYVRLGGHRIGRPQTAQEQEAGMRNYTLPENMGALPENMGGNPSGKKRTNEYAIAAAQERF